MISIFLPYLGIRAVLYDVVIYPVEMLFIGIYHVVYEGPVHAYEMLFRNLSNIQKKEYIGYADISCVQDETGAWQTDAADNVSVRNAILGGMLEEIRILADV